MNTRNGTLSPVSTDSQEWSPITRYQNIAGDNPYSPTLPPNNTPPYANNADGGMRQRRPPGNGNPSPPSSIGRSSDGTGLYSSRASDASLMSNRKMQALEDTMSEHFHVLKAYLGPYLNDEKGNPRPSRAKDKLTRLSAVQFQELSTDVYDESIRRELDRKRGPPRRATTRPSSCSPRTASIRSGTRRARSCRRCPSSASASSPPMSSTSSSGGFRASRLETCRAPRVLPPASRVA
jgi:hypothetical protein